MSNEDNDPKAERRTAARAAFEPSKAPDRDMEEILASIRRLIADDETKSPQVEARLLAHLRRNETFRDQALRRAYLSRDSNLGFELELEALRLSDEYMRRETQKYAWLTVFTAALGLASAIGVLIAHYPSVALAIETLLRTSSFHLFVTPAFAQAATATSVTTPIGPIIIYGVYVLLTTAYLVTLYAVFFVDNSTSRTRANEMFRTLTSFFIGVASGQLL